MTDEERAAVQRAAGYANQAMGAVEAYRHKFPEFRAAWDSAKGARDALDGLLGLEPCDGVRPQKG